MITLQQIYCEGSATTLGLDTQTPKFSWIIKSDKSNVTQKHYNIQISTDIDFKSIYWDSLQVETPCSQSIIYSGALLFPRTKYYYRVKIGTINHGESDWSTVQWFETSRLKEPWNASFISRNDCFKDNPSRPLYLRKEFSLKNIPEKGRLYASALGIYEIQINGKEVNKHYFAPGWTNYNKRLAYQTVDITSLLKKGTNIITTTLAPGWYAGILTWFNKNKIYGDTPAFIAEMILTEKNGQEKSILSDESWQAGYGPISYCEFYNGEHYNANNGIKNWNQPDFTSDNFRKCDLIQVDKSVLIAQDGVPVISNEVLPGIELLTTPKGEKVIDFGQNITGVVRFKLTGKKNDKIVIRHAEILDNNGNFYLENMRNAENKIEYTFSGNGVEEYQSHFSFQGFRYIRIEEYPYEITRNSFSAVVLHSQMNETLKFKCSNPLLNQLHRNILWGWKGNSVDIPSDCPQRDERLGWTGDAQVFIPTASYLMNVQPFFRKWIRDMISEQKEDGGIPFVIPDVLTPLAHLNTDFKESDSSTGWADAIVICPWILYKRYGDTDILSEAYPAIIKWIAYMQNNSEDGLLWKDGFHFGDWLALDAEEGSYLGATPNEFTATAYYAHSVNLTSKIASILNKYNEAEKYHILNKDIISAMQNEYFNSKGGLKFNTQTSHILALKFNIVEESFRKQLARNLVKLINKNSGHLDTGFLGTPLITHALSDNGFSNEAYKLLLKEDYPSWIYPIHKGATTIWEHWDGLKPDGTMWSADMNSFNHYAYGSIGEWMYKNIGGLDLDKSDIPNRKFQICFNPGGGITESQLIFQSIYGNIEVNWEMIGDCKPYTYKLEIIIPANCKGSIDLNGYVVEASSANVPILSGKTSLIVFEQPHSNL